MTRGANTGSNAWVEKLYSGTMITHCCLRLLHNITVFIKRLFDFGFDVFEPVTGRLLPFARCILNLTPLWTSCWVCWFFFYTAETLSPTLSLVVNVKRFCRCITNKFYISIVYRVFFISLILDWKPLECPKLQPCAGFKEMCWKWSAHCNCLSILNSSNVSFIIAGATNVVASESWTVCPRVFGVQKHFVHVLQSLHQWFMCGVRWLTLSAYWFWAGRAKCIENNI